MAKSLRSKIKRKFRTELRKRVGVPHQAKMEAKIQENLKHALEAQGGGKSVFELKKLMGSTGAPVTADASMEVDGKALGAAADTEAELMNDEAEAPKDKKKAPKKPAAKRRKKKFVHFHTLRKKGV